MRFVPRLMEAQVRLAAAHFPAVVLTGPRRAGKTALLRRLISRGSYHLFEAPDLVARFRSDPQGFLDGVKLPAILDEIQNVPEVFNHVRARIDQTTRKPGQWFLAGSQEAPLMRNVTESMAGRSAVLRLLPLSARESSKVTLLRGGYPEVIAHPRAVRLWFSSYLQTYLERDVRGISTLHDLVSFRRFMGLLASRHGAVLNKTDLAAPLGMSVPTVGRWLDVLELTGQILVVPPYFENFGKRIIKAPKVYFTDSGLACHLLGIETERELERSPFLGAIFEGMVAAEIVKAQLNAGRRQELFFFRDQQGLEIDFLVPGKNGSVTLIEAKASRTPKPEMAMAMHRLAAARGTRPGHMRQWVVYRPPRTPSSSRALARNAEAIPWPDLVNVDLPRLLD